MLNEYDVVKAKERLSEKVYKGCEGTILMIFETPSIAYEVEFVDDYCIWDNRNHTVRKLKNPA